jgi:hypothetical protein
VQEGLERVAPEPWFVARLAPAGADARAVAQAAARYDVTTRLQGLTQRVLADVDDVVWCRRPPSWTTCTTAWRARGARGAKG